MARVSEDQRGGCPQDEAIRAYAQGKSTLTAVRSHVASCKQCAERLSLAQAQSQLTVVVTPKQGADCGKDIPSSSVAGPCAAQVDRPGDELPERIGKYKVLRRLSAGTGQAVVYRAWNPVLEKDVVIKLGLRRLSGDPTQLDEIVKEGRLLKEVEHPGVARVYDLDLDRDRPFLVLELVEGRSLEQLLADGRHSPDESARILASVARTVEHLHSLGVTHRDIKPANIIVEKGTGTARLIDLGFSAMRDALQNDRHTPGQLSGTACYMSPEQARGDEAGLRPPSDIFALGATLYAVLCGRPPYGAPDAPREQALRVALDRARRCDFDRHALEAPDIPRRLAETCLRAMETEPEKRFRSAADFAAALERFASPRRLPWPWVATAAALLLVAGIAWIVADGVGGSRQQSSADPSGHASVVPRPASEPEPVPDLRPGWGGKPSEGSERGERLDWPPIPTGGSVELCWDIPAGLEPSLFWLDTEGKVTEHRFMVVAQEGSRKTVRMPHEPGQFMEIGDAAGTEVVFLCARRGKALSLEEVRSLIAGEESRWPLLGEREVLQFDLERVWCEGPTPIPAAVPKGTTRGAIRLTKAPIGPSDRAVKLQARLREQCQWLRGIAFAHVE